MNEVSCRATSFLFLEMKKRGVPLDRVFHDLRYPIAHLQNKAERIDWETFRQIMRNAGQIWSDSELEACAGSVFHAPVLRHFIVMFRFLMSMKDVYRYGFTPKTGAGNQLISCIRPNFEDLGGNRIRVYQLMQPGYAPSREFFIVSKGVLTSQPQFLFGLDRAAVDMKLTSEGAVFDITLPPGGTTVWWRILGSWLFAVRGAAKDLKDAHEDLHKRYLQLEGTQQRLAKQTRQLQTAQQISSAIHSDLDLERVLQSVARALVETAGFVGASIEVDVAVEGNPIKGVAKIGERIAPESGLRRALFSRGRELGHLAVDGPVDGAAELVEVLLPTIALAVENAIAFKALTNYRIHLEDRVKDRTARLEAALGEVKEQQAARQRIFQNISHELRTPLSLIGLSTGDILFRDGETLSEKSKERLGQIDDSIHRLLHLFDGMLLLAAGQEGKLRIRPVSTDIAISLRSLVSAWQLAAEKHALQLHYAGPDRLAVQVDEPGIERVVSNLLSNAIKFTPQGGSIEVRLEEVEGNRIRISVQDSGVGMDREFLGRVFGRFEQGPAPVRAGERGSGIGLAIVKEIAEAHGGTATVESERGRGSTFIITLPKQQNMEKLAALGEGSFIPALQERAPERETETIPSTTDVRPASKTATTTILVAEDDPALRQFLIELLSRDYRVVAASDGLGALRLAKEHQPALLVSDIGMPGIDGIELTRRFRAASADKLAPVILLTAFATVETRLKGLDAGAIDYVTKPFHPEELLSRVRGQLQLRELAMRLHESQKLAGLGILSAGLAHELRNPANGVVNAIGPLKKMLPPEVLKAGTSTALLLDAMSTGAEQIAVLTRQLLGFSRQGELDVRDEPMSRILDSALALVEPAMGGRVLKREIGYAEKVRCARGLVVQILVNLLENAAHAAPAGGEIVVTTRLEKDFVMFEVRDSGPGVPKEMRSRIFDPFFTTKPPGQGTGLGLTISKMIAERHGGNLRLLDSEKGAAFRLELPAARVELPKTSPVLEGATLGGHS